MAAITAGQALPTQWPGAAPRVLLLDSQRLIGAKILVAGGGRCNVTNVQVDASRFNTAPQPVPLHKSFVARVLRSYPVEQTHRFFDQHGVPLKLEETGKYFPVSNSARSVLNALLNALRSSGAQLCTETPVHALNPIAGAESSLNGPRYKVRTPAHEIEARSVVLCTGGLALPKSGSNGTGYELARRLGHTIVATTPALSPLIAQPAVHAALSGVTLPARISLLQGSRTVVAFAGSFLFTHTGYSGPPALNISRHFAHFRTLHPDCALELCLLPDIEPANESRSWHQWVARDAKKSLLNCLCALLPRRVAEMVIAAAAAPAQCPLGRLPAEIAARLRRELFHCPLPVVSVAPYSKAEATAGGISLAEIDPAHMMSRLHDGLYFAGEICDVDGWLGGYNFQWAWSSGQLAGRCAAKEVLGAS